VYQRIRQTAAVPQRVKDHDDDTMSTWRMTYWKWYNTVLVLASKELPTDLILHKLQCGEQHDFRLYPFHIQNVQILQPNDHFTWEEFCHWLVQPGLLHKNFIQMKLSSTKMEKETKLHV
jgi:hypothetical protein